MDLITTGRSASSRGSQMALAGEVKKLLSGPNPPRYFDALLKTLQGQAQSDTHVSAQDLREVILNLHKEDFLTVGSGHNPEIRVQV